MSPIDPTRQAHACLVAFASWIADSPATRRVVLSMTLADGWTVTLDEKRATHGRSILDACAQAGTVINADGAP